MIIDILKAQQAFGAMAVLDDGALPLDRAALAIAAEEYPGLDTDGYLRRLDVLAARAEVLIGDSREPARVIDGLNEVLFVQEGLSGNGEDYYDPRNSFLNEVLDRRLGIPISLSIIYMEVARRIGFPIGGVGLPGHFLVKHKAAGRGILIDPFHRGRILTLSDCQELLDRIHDGAITVDAALLEPMGNRAILTRMLYNLKAIYTQREEHLKALSAVDKILMLNPGVPSEIRDRGLLYMQTGLFARALASLEVYLTRTAAPEDSPHVRDNIRMLRGVVCAEN
ncbi:MAG: transglutaminase family protein [Acidobacteria bacterium]|nr:transglutaminase family protein [Acidobacteriota bacterium]